VYKLTVNVGEDVAGQRSKQILVWLKYLKSIDCRNGKCDVTANCDSKKGPRFKGSAL